MRAKPTVETEHRIAALSMVNAILAEQLQQAQERALRLRRKLEVTEAERDELRAERDNHIREVCRVGTES